VRHLSMPNVDRGASRISGFCPVAGALLQLWRNEIVALMLGLVTLAAGCSSVVTHPDPLPTREYVSTDTEYRIQPGDQIDVKFFYNPELNESVIVRPDGRVSLQLINAIQTSGLTPAELTQELKRSYARELNQPELTVIMREFAGQRVYVDGEVKNPGSVPLAPEMTVLQSLAMAGGLMDSARTHEIVVIRREPRGKPQTFTLNLAQVLDGSNMGQDLTLMPLDVVYVPKSPIANVNLWVDQYLRQNVPVSAGLYYQP